MILADTSAWVEYDRATGSFVDRRLAELIADDGPLATSEPVIMEVLAGARDDRREAELRRLLLRFELLQFDVAADFQGAIRIYRRCRAAAIIPRGLIDWYRLQPWPGALVLPCWRMTPIYTALLRSLESTSTARLFEYPKAEHIWRRGRQN